MVCLIISESNDLPVDFWNCEKKENMRKSNIRKSNGTFIKIDGEIYILTCYHCIEDNNINNEIYYYDIENNFKKTSAILKFSLKELDIALLKPRDNIENISYFDTKQELLKLSDIIEKNMKIITIVKNGKEYKRENIKKKEIEAEFLKIEKEKYIDVLTLNYKIPSIYFKLKKNIELEGMSGSILYQNNSPIGILYSVNNRNLSAFPFCLCIEILKSGLNKNKYLSSPLFSYDLCEIEFEQGEISRCNSQHTRNILENISSKSKEITGIYLKDTFDISYKKKNKNFNFFQEDLIISIDSKKINDDGTIYCNILNYDVNVFVYFLVNLYINDSVEITFMRKNILSTINLSCRKFNDLLPFHITKSNDYIKYEGFIFAELSVELLEYYKTKNISLFGNIKKIKDGKINKYVALVYIDYEYLKNNYKNKNEISEFEKLNFPYVNNKILILNKVGNNNVIDLNSLRQILSKKLFNKQSTLCFNMYEQQNDESYGSSIQIESNSNYTQFIRYVC